jgi:hypothetical protein
VEDDALVLCGEKKVEAKTEVVQLFCGAGGALVTVRKHVLR